MFGRGYQYDSYYHNKGNNAGSFMRGVSSAVRAVAFFLKFLRVRVFYIIGLLGLLSVLYVVAYMTNVTKVLRRKAVETAYNASITLGLVAKEVTVSGNNFVGNEEISRLLHEQEPLTLWSLDKLRYRIKLQSPWIKEVSISRVWANGRVHICIEEYTAFANWYHHGINSIIDDTGHIIVNSTKRFDNLVSIYGNGALEDLHFVKDVLSHGGILGSMVSSFDWLGGGKWNVNFSSGLQVRLPEKAARTAWNNLELLHKKSGELLMWKVVDMRAVDKIFVKK